MRKFHHRKQRTDLHVLPEQLLADVRGGDFCDAGSGGVYTDYAYGPGPCPDGGRMTQIGICTDVKPTLRA